ncbi:MAG: Rpn family recombination-promoting nuclease/putative transposase [Ruminococcus sp.]|jgi:predicted transposase/invertase (TIGR01784 family)|nr:Rpn family recombination-promoting nuclease/putative transposase [Ruminococcus sp.]
MINEELVVKPKIDVIFKKLFVENIDFLRDFLSVALDIPYEDFSDIKITNPELIPDSSGEKLSRLDILVRKPDGTKLNIEMQNCDEGDYKVRSVYYCSKLFTKDVLSGDEYRDIPKTICINILQFTLFENADWKCTVFPTITETGEAVTDKWQILYFQTKKLPNKNSGGIIDWLKFFTIKTKGDINEMKENAKDVFVNKALEAVELMNEDEKTRRLAEAREEAIFREKWILRAAKRETAFDIAKNMFSLGVPIDIITKSTGLPPSEIAKLAEQT